MVKIDAANAENILTFMGQAPTTIEPTLPIMLHNDFE